jgi:hypothetical protein
MFLQLSSGFTPLKMQDPELVNQLKERLPEALFEKLNGSLSIDRDRLRFAEYKVRVLEERLRLVRIEKYGPGSEKLSDDQLELLELEPGISSAEVEAESPVNRSRRHRVFASRIRRTGVAAAEAWLVRVASETPSLPGS